MSGKGDCRTAPATPGLLIINVFGVVKTEVNRIYFIFSCWFLVNMSETTIVLGTKIFLNIYMTYTVTKLFFILSFSRLQHDERFRFVFFFHFTNILENVLLRTPLIQTKGKFKSLLYKLVILLSLISICPCYLVMEGGGGGTPD